MSRAVLLFHKLGHVSGKEAGASVEVLLKEGVLSKHLLRQKGKLPHQENPYLKLEDKRREWIEERKQTLKDQPKLLQAVLDDGTQEKYWTNLF